jgi:hypothetical protein
VRGWPGHKEDDVFCSSDLTLNAEQIIESYCLRWSLEVTFEETKGKLGFEDAQNRTERAVERTAPMALWVYTLVVVWYLTTGKNLKTSRLPQFPWYRKAVPAFSDMLAALRPETWARRLLDPAGFDRSDQKSVARFWTQSGMPRKDARVRAGAAHWTNADDSLCLEAEVAPTADSIPADRPAVNAGRPCP